MTAQDDRVQLIAVAGFALIAIVIIVAWTVVAIATDDPVGNPLDVITLLVALFAISAGVTITIARKPSSTLPVERRNGGVGTQVPDESPRPAPGGPEAGPRPG